MMRPENNTLSQAARKKRWNLFLAMDPAVTRMSMIECTEGMPQRPPLWPSQKQARIDWMVRHHEWQARQATWLDDDHVTHLDCLTGTEIFAEAFGCTVHRPDDQMPFALPCVENAHEASRLKIPDLADSTLAILFDIADAAREKAGRDVPLRLPDIQSPMDVAALIWDKADFYVAMIESPEAVREFAEKIRLLQMAFLDEWFRRYGNACIAHFPPYWMEQGLSISEDEIGVVNPDMFETFFLPELQALSDRYGGIGMHCCADAVHQWDGFLRIPGLKFLNLIQPAKTLQRAIPYFSPHVAQWHETMGSEDPQGWRNAVPETAHMVLSAKANTRKEAQTLAERFRDGP